MRNSALIVAAGRGSRMMQSVPKQYLLLNERAVLRHTIEIFINHPLINNLLVVINAKDETHYAAAVNQLESSKLCSPVLGGSTRALSVRLGLEALSAMNPQNVIIHDAARPLCPSKLIDAVLDPLDTVDGAFAALPITDALWKVENGYALQPVNREQIWRAQTPQAFRFQKILNAHSNSDASAKDDVEVALRANLTIKAVHGAEDNFKITHPSDLTRAAHVMRQRLL